MIRPGHQPPQWIPWQMSLRTLIIVATAMGTLAGIFGPNLVRTLRKRRSYERPPIQTPYIRVYEDTSNGYFESAETPLH